MDEPLEAFGATKRASSLLVMFIPSTDRLEQAIDQEFWVNEALEMLGNLFGGATAYPKGKGVWRDDTHAGILIYDEPVIIQCYTKEELIEQHAWALRAFLWKMGGESNQGAVGLVVDGDYLEMTSPFGGG